MEAKAEDMMLELAALAEALGAAGRLAAPNLSGDDGAVVLLHVAQSVAARLDAMAEGLWAERPAA